MAKKLSKSLLFYYNAWIIVIIGPFRSVLLKVFYCKVYFLIPINLLFLQPISECQNHDNALIVQWIE